MSLFGPQEPNRVSKNPTVAAALILHSCRIRIQAERAARPGQHHHHTLTTTDFVSV
jgi:hypothetical protein